MIRKILALFIMVLSCMLVPERASSDVGDLTISPWRVVFGGRDRSAIVQLLNTSDTTNTYRIGWMLTKVQPSGKYDQEFYDREKDKDPHIVPNMVITSPRQVTIEPHGIQVVRLSLRRPADLPPGEYRGHMTLIKLANTQAEERRNPDPNDKTISMEMKVNYGFSIPIIVRQGDDSDLKISLQSPKLRAVKNGSALDVTVRRDAGKFSSYGEIDVFWTPPSGKEIQIGLVSNIALYPEIKERRVSVPLLREHNVTGGTLRVVYVGKLESEGKTWAENKFQVGK